MGGLKRAVAVAVGEKHSLAVQRWSAAQLEGMAQVPWLQADAAAVAADAAGATSPGSSDADLDRWYQTAADGLAADELAADGQLGTPRGEAGADGSPSGTALLSPNPGASRPSPGPSPVRLAPRRPAFGAAAAAAGARGPPSLQHICEAEVARRLVDPRTCLQARPAIGDC